MWRRTLTIAGLATMLATGGTLAQTTPAPSGTKPHSPAATSAAPSSAPSPAGTVAKPGSAGTTAPAMGSTASLAKPDAGGKVNLNTANATQLDALPGIGEARAKAILAERAKGPFKDWSDFDTRTAHSSVNAGVKSKLKDRVTF